MRLAAPHLCPHCKLLQILLHVQLAVKEGSHRNQYPKINLLIHFIRSLCEKNSSQKRSPLPYPQDSREIEYLKRILKPFISYPESKVLENFHPKVPTDFQACRNALVITMQDTCKASFCQIMDTRIRKKAG